LGQFWTLRLCFNQFYCPLYRLVPK